MGLVEADLGSWCACEYGHFLYPFTCPTLGSPFSHSLRAICTVLLDPLLQSERMQGFAADPVYVKGVVFAYVGLPQNLKDLKHQSTKAPPLRVFLVSKVSPFVETVTIKTRSLGRAVWREPGSLSVVYLVLQNGNLE